ncbi:hypothetical protein ET445_17025 [Agromyces protaetiae]|uniref:Uncharacterized protein n=1 Tax=Agromyces protaetiae TaxID=2509455 RepID=A0A4P6FI16_9MICO|nr:hypothetical protein [Agromyces protaetiae]QAY74783.1 hypothetical protein ET445_17025 [Agromyces protaetiae]
MSFHAVERLVPAAGTRVVVETDAPFAELRRRFEEIVPATDPDLGERLAAGALDWAAFSRAASSLYGLRRFGTDEVGDTMRRAGGAAASVAYLLGDHELHARLFRHDPATVIAVPFRAELHAGRGGAVFSFEQPGPCSRRSGSTRSPRSASSSTGGSAMCSKRSSCRGRRCCGGDERGARARRRQSAAVASAASSVNAAAAPPALTR